MKKTVQQWNRSTKAREPALHTHARQEVHKDELGTCEDPRRVDSVGVQLMPNGLLTGYKRKRKKRRNGISGREDEALPNRFRSFSLTSCFLCFLLHRVPVQVSWRLALFVERPECVLQHLRPVPPFLCVAASRDRHLFAALFAFR